MLIKEINWILQINKCKYKSPRYILDLQYFEWNGVKKDFVKTIYYYKKAAEKGNSNALKKLSDFYYDGQCAKKKKMTLKQLIIRKHQI